MRSMGTLLGKILSDSPYFHICAQEKISKEDRRRHPNPYNLVRNVFSDKLRDQQPSVNKRSLHPLSMLTYQAVREGVSSGKQLLLLLPGVWCISWYCQVQSQLPVLHADQDCPQACAYLPGKHSDNANDVIRGISLSLLCLLLALDTVPEKKHYL